MVGLLEIRESGRGMSKRVGASRFTCSLGKVHNKESALDFLQGVKATFPRATHNPHACRIGDPIVWEDSNDDGEPRGTAGGAILAVIERENVTNIMAVVSRMYGGRNLGTGRLSKAYATTVLELINAIGTQPVLD